MVVIRRKIKLYHWLEDRTATQKDDDDNDAQHISTDANHQHEEEVQACRKFVFATFILISENGGTSTDMVVENKYIFRDVPLAPYHLPVEAI